jgi:hypothetical protein
MRQFILICVVMVLMLTACGGDATETPLEVVETEVKLNDRPEFEMPVQTQLMLGTFMLEGTEFEVVAEQAPELITLWKALQTLSTSDTTAEAEIEAVVNQIQDAMTSDQLTAIQEMDLTQESLRTLMGELDIQQGEGFTGADREGQPEGFPEGGFPGGGLPGGGLGGGQGQGMGPGGQGFGENLTPEQLATMEAMRAERGGGLRNRANLFLIEPLIELLEGKVG